MHKQDTPKKSKWERSVEVTTSLSGMSITAVLELRSC